MIELSLRDSQQASLGVMNVIAKICESEKMTYSLVFGTLIGAIRHKGFIPWDDDIDIAMPRPDYERFCKYCEEHQEDMRPFKLLNLNTCSSYPYMISRMSDCRYYLDVTNERDYGLGIFVDIYPLDGLGNDYDAACQLMAKIRKYPRLMFLSTRQYYHFGTTQGWKKRLLKVGAFCYARLRGKEYFRNKIMSMVDTHCYDISRYVGCAVWGAGDKVFVFDKEKMGKLIFVDFEGGKYRSYAGWDYLLTEWFGDYMQLPPERDRVPHHLYKTYMKDMIKNTPPSRKQRVTSRSRRNRTFHSEARNKSVYINN